MDELTEERETGRGERQAASLRNKWVKLLLAGTGALWLAYFILNWFDTATELVPGHDTALEVCFILGGLGAVLAATLTLFQWRRLSTPQRIVWPPAAALMGFLTIFLFSSETATIAENKIDFPSTQTKSLDGFLLISRAYWTHGKSQSWNIQTMPVWSNMQITQSDYNFMLAHRPTSQSSSDRDEIRSDGYFCAHVTLQQTDKALRVLHAGRQKLPQGTVVLCPR